MKIRPHIFSLIAAGLATGCTSHLAMLGKDKYDTQVALDEMRIELSDVKHTLSNTQVEMQILEDRLRSHDTTLQSTKSHTFHLADGADQKIQLLEKRIAQIEKMQDKISSEIRQLSSYASQSTNSFAQFQRKINELESEAQSNSKMIHDLSDLKGTLSSISQAIHKGGGKTSTTTYRVKAGDTLEKIARGHHTTVELIKKHNGLTSTKIFVGQEIKLPHGES